MQIIEEGEEVVPPLEDDKIVERDHGVEISLCYFG